jgi:oligopeptide transport system substrate-binding protein
MHKIVFNFLLILTTVLCIQCSPTSSKEKTVFRYNQIGGMETLDPAFAKSLAIMWGTHFIYNTLLEVDDNLLLTPSLAQSWSVSDDGLTYTFHLRNDVYFHDNPIFPKGKGRKMTAEDVVYSFNRLIDPNTAAAGAWIFNDRVQKQNPFEYVNDTLLRIHLQAPFKPLPQILTMQYCGIVPKEVVTHWGKDFRNHPCGTGPFTFQYWDEGNTLVLHKNEHYWEVDEQQRPLPYLDAVQVFFNDTRAVEFLMFNQGKTDFMNGVDGSMKDLILSRKGTLKPEFEKRIHLHKQHYLYTEYLGFMVDTQHIALKNNPIRVKKIRQAINYAIDREKIVTYFRNGVGIPASANRGFVPEGLPQIVANTVKGYDYNPQKALDLLEEAGFPKGKNLPTITLTTPDAYVDIGNFVANQLNEVGIHTQVQVMLAGLLRQMMTKNELPFFKAGWVADYPDPETFLACFYSAFPSPPNYTQFKNKQYDLWYQQSLSTLNDTLRYELYNKMDSLISEEAVVVPLFYDQILHFTHHNIRGMQTNALNIIDIKRVQKPPLKHN